jgi:hypothetical protein
MLYQISKNCHYASWWPTIHIGITEIYGTFTIDSSCKYDLSDNIICSRDTNKIIGFSYGLGIEDFKKWSIRIGWRVTNGNLLLFLYVYNNGVRTITRLGYPKTFKFDVEYPYQIINDRDTNKAIIIIGNHSLFVPFDKIPAWGYVLKPYFGGECPAPENMFIDLEFTTI